MTYIVMCDRYIVSFIVIFTFLRTCSLHTQRHGFAYGYSSSLLSCVICTAVCSGLNYFCVIRHKFSISVIVTSLSSVISVLSKRICFITMSKSSLGPVSFLFDGYQGKVLEA